MCGALSLKSAGPRGRGFFLEGRPGHLILKAVSITLVSPGGANGRIAG
jgi:hypothetical protein